MSSIGKLERQHAADTPFKQYIGLGIDDQSPQELSRLLQLHRDDQTGDKNTPLSHAAVCIELAYEATTPRVAGMMLDEAQEQFEVLDAREDEHRKGMDYVRRGALFESFMPRIRRSVVDRELPSLHDERAIWLGAIGLLDESDLEMLEAKNTAPIVNAEATIHALVARDNLRRNDIRYQTWQTLPRFAFYDRTKGNQHNEWNVGLTKGSEATDYQRLIVRHGHGVVRGTIAAPTYVANLTEITGIEPLDLMNELRSEVELDGPQRHELLDRASRNLSTFVSHAMHGSGHSRTA